ncbi:hypothetical protein [Vallicoccus soli]|uniref:STAS domain-containing protein n=1 Tax=Vallicoccus soli TaxID=2339232 RepID=A0A3A3Z1E9_9ACTN|nr:hypothetical protein [Vallicoccus soli]RJK97003.1 hypothetical protein D5H78_07130 [Vallicoccus soli]
MPVTSYVHRGVDVLAPSGPLDEPVVAALRAGLQRPLARRAPVVVHLDDLLPGDRPGQAALVRLCAEAAVADEHLRVVTAGCPCNALLDALEAAGVPLAPDLGSAARAVRASTRDHSCPG